MNDPIHSGWHLVLDATVRDDGPISSVDGLRRFLLELVERLGMDLLDGPRMTEVALDPSRLASSADEGGITGYCLITTSHISIHTWPLRRRFCLDIFSCRRFDGPAIAALIRDRLAVEADRTTWLERTWPEPAPAAADTREDLEVPALG